MIQTSEVKIVFLLCVPRSGSSLTTYMLQNHSQISAAQEMWFLMKLHDLRVQESRPYGGSPIIARFFNSVLSDEMFIRACRGFALQVYQDLLHIGGGRMIIDKSPRYYCLLEFLDRLFPSSRRIFLTRNPLDIAASYKKLHQGPSPYDLASRLYAETFDMKMIDLTVGLLRYADYFAVEHDYACRVSYEQLVQHPKEELTRLCSFLGLEYEEGIERYGDYLHTSKSDLFFSMGVGDPLLLNHSSPHTQSLGQWQEVLTPREMEALCRALGAELFQRLGYQEVLEQVEARCGVRFEQHPDQELIERRTRELAEAAGYAWEPAYRMTIPSLREDQHSLQRFAVNPNMAVMRSSDSAEAGLEQEVLRLKTVLRTVEQRLQDAYDERDHYKKQYIRLRGKVDRLKSWIPFHHLLTK